MGRFAERVRDLRLRAESPDGQITARLAGGSQLDFSFAAGTYRGYDEATLSAQLSAVLSTLFDDYRRARFDALSQTTMENSGLTAEPVNPRSLDNRGRVFHERRRTVEARGKSPQDTVRVSRVGKSDWAVRIRPGSLGRLDETGFKHELAGGIAAAQYDYQFLVGALRAEFYPARTA